MKAGFIGLGAMGRHMAGNLQRAGHQVQAFDVRKVEGFPDWKASAADAARDAEVVFTSLPGPKEVEAIAKEIGPAMRKGAAWFDLSTNSPSLVRRLARELSHISFLDAPVSGGTSGAESGKLAVWVGGDEAVFRKHEKLIRDFADQPLYVGPIGAGTVAKLAHNTASFSVQAALAEIVTLGVKAGVDPVQLFRAIRQGATGRKRTFDRLADHFLPGVYDPPTFTLGLAHKDVTLALELARECGVPMQVAEIALAELAQGIERFGAQRDCRMAMRLQEERAGIALRASPDRLQDALKE
jgi:3-hydroxyisobutyrate dehydrogenase